MSPLRCPLCKRRGSEKCAAQCEDMQCVQCENMQQSGFSESPSCFCQIAQERQHPYRRRQHPHRPDHQCQVHHWNFDLTTLIVGNQVILQSGDND